MIVVDTNVVAYLYLPSEHTARAERLLEREPEWVLPTLWRSEFRNLLAGYLRRGALTLADVLAVQAEAESLVEGCEYEVASDRVLTLVQRSTCSAYDCEFVALAQEFGVRLVTADAKLRRAFPDLTEPLPPAT
jgi:predicted nucleic acid-binding protein